MTVGELIEQLQKESPSRLVVMAKDAEGNDHSPLYGFYAGHYKAHTTWSGEVQGDGEEPMIGAVPALVLSPVN